MRHRPHLHAAFHFAAAPFLLLAVASCWNWSFPDKLLDEDADASADGPQQDGGAGGETNMGGMSGMTGGGGAGMSGGRGGSQMGGKGGGAGSATAGTGGSVCAGGCREPFAPVCSNGVCRPCSKHEECPSGLCALDGSCPAPTDVAFVDDDCGATRNGAAATPFCRLTEALTDPRPYLLLAAGSYQAAAIDADRRIYGRPGARVTGAGCGALTITGGADVTLAGLTLATGVSVDGQGSRLTLVANTIGPSACTGVEAKGASKLIASRNFITSNTKGGILIDSAASDIVNNIIVDNGNAETTFGGVWLKPSGQQVFVNNTVAGNKAKASKREEVGGVYCEARAILVNTIIWGNAFGRSTPPPGRQYAGLCELQDSLVETEPGDAPGAGNLTADPRFVGTPVGTAAAYHLQPGSPAANKGTATAAPQIDFDGAARADGMPDLGADEL